MSEDQQDLDSGTDAPEEGEVNLEHRLGRLEEIVRALEEDDLELEKALALFAEGVGHVRGAQKLLAEAELRVEELLGDNEDLHLHARPTDPDTE